MLLETLLPLGKVDPGLRAHLEAGADHVSIQVLGNEISDGHRALAEALELT